MRIPVLYLHEAEEVSGAEQSLLELVTRLDRGSFDPFVACPAPGPFADLLARKHIPVIPLTFMRIRGMRGVCATMVSLLRILDDHPAAIVHSNSIRTHLYGVLASRLKGSKAVWHERNLITDEKIDPERVLAFAPDALICNSHAVARRFEQNGRMPAKVVIIHNAVDTRRFSPDVGGGAMRDRFAIGRDRIVIGIVARYNPIKGHETYFTAAQKLLDQMPGARERLTFFVVGGAVFAEDRRREDDLRGLVHKLGIAGNVVFAGPVTDMPAAYAAMDVVVLASRYEACARVIPEAMAMGRPVVATDVGGAPEVLVNGETGLLFPVDDADALVGMLRDLCEDAAKRSAMGRAGRSRAVGLFSIERHVMATEQLYLKLVRPGGNQACLTKGA